MNLIIGVLPPRIYQSPKKEEDREGCKDDQELLPSPTVQYLVDQHSHWNVYHSNPQWGFLTENLPTCFTSVAHMHSIVKQGSHKCPIAKNKVAALHEHCKQPESSVSYMLWLFLSLTPNQTYGHTDKRTHGYRHTWSLKQLPKCNLGKETWKGWTLAETLLTIDNPIITLANTWVLNTSCMIC